MNDVKVKGEISVRELYSELSEDVKTSFSFFWFKRFYRNSSSRELQSILREAMGWRQENENAAADQPPPRVRRPSQFGENQTFSEKEVIKILRERSRVERHERYKSFVGMLTLHGYPQFDTTSGIRKFLWGCILLVMTGLVLRLAHLLYSPENVLKQIIELETEKSDSLDFPTVTICSFSPQYVPGMYERFPVNITEAEFKQFYYQLLSNRRENVETMDKPLINRVLEELKQAGYTSYRDVLSLFEKNREEDINSLLVKKIMHRTRCLYENKPCDWENDFRLVYRHSSQSLCIQFNYYQIGKESRVTYGNDLENGFTMFWDISGTHYFYDLALHGLLMEIHPYGTPHHLVDNGNTIYLEPGSKAHLDIVEVETHRLLPPYMPNCGHRVLEVLQDYPYSEQVCETDCYLEKAVHKCGCVPDQFEDQARNYRVCKTVDMPCVFRATTEVHCHDCPVSCHDIQYDISHTLLSIGNDHLAEGLKKDSIFLNKTKDEIVLYMKNNIIGFRIGFKTLERTLRNYVEAMAWFDRASLFGGTLGLLMGVIVTTCFEFFFFVIDYVVIYIKYRLFQTYINYLMIKAGRECKVSPRTEKIPEDLN